ncbi:MAG: tetratricopeptide repeat protein [Rhizobiaceae bacterium]
MAGSISRKVELIGNPVVGLLTAAFIFGSVQCGVALDPEQVLADDKLSIGKLFQNYFSARKDGRNEDAVSLLKYGADNGSLAAQWKLGRIYQTGDGVSKNAGEAMRLFEKIVVNHNDAPPYSQEAQFTSSAMLALGQYLKSGVPEAGIESNPARARQMFTTAATYFSNSQAQFELARMYLEDENSVSNTIRAARLLKSASSSGHIGAEALLGHLLFEGKHISHEPVRGLAMMMRAKDKATELDIDWITKLQEEAFALASETERRTAYELVANLP